MLRVAFIFGGVSSEHDISLLSVSSILENVDSSKIEAVAVGITKCGKWYIFSGDISDIKNGKWQDDTKNLKPCILSPDREHYGLLVNSENSWELLKLDAVFPVLHGKNGEDGSVQGLLQLSGIAFVGCDMVSSVSCMDKHIAKLLLRDAGIAVANWLVVDKAYNLDEILKSVDEKLKYPVFVKPSKSGSSVGVSKVQNSEELGKALELAFVEDDRVIIEEGIVGAEIECAVMGDTINSEASKFLGEIEPTDGFYDFDGKYKNNTTILHIPARLDADMTEKVLEIARKAYRVLGCSGLSRVDFFVSDKSIILNEINTLPGFTSISMFPKLFMNTGYSYSEIITKLIDYALGVI